MSMSVTDFLTDPTVHNALLSSMAATAIITAMPRKEDLRNVKWHEIPLVLYGYVYDVLHIFMSLKSGQQAPPPPPIPPASTAPESQPTKTPTKENP